MTMAPEVKIEDMLGGDILEVISIGLNTPEFKTGTNAQQFYGEQTLKRWIVDPNGVTLVARIGGKIAGFSLGYYMAGPNDGYLNCVTVKPSYRGRGFGKKLLKRSLSEFLKKGECNHVFGVVGADNLQAIDFFKNNGLEIGKEFRYVERMLS